MVPCENEKNFPGAPRNAQTFLRRKFVVKTNTRYFKAVAADTKLDHSFQSSKEGHGGIRGQTNHQAYVTAWKLVYHKVLAINKGYGEISNTVLANTDANPWCKELRNRNILEYNDIKKQQIIFFTKERDNPYETTMPMKFYNFTSLTLTRQLVGPEISVKILEFFY